MAHASSSHPAGPGHETRDVSLRPVLLTAAIGVAATLFFIAAMWVLIDVSAERQAAESPPPNPLAAQFARKEPPAPRLQANPLDDIRILRAQEDAILGSYGWVDREAGTVRLPIARAKDLLAERARSAGGRP